MSSTASTSRGTTSVSLLLPKDRCWCMSCRPGSKMVSIGSPTSSELQDTAATQLSSAVKAGHNPCTYRCAKGPCMLFSLTEAATCCSCTSRAEQAKCRLCGKHCLGLSATTDRQMKGRRDTSWVQQTCKLAMACCDVPTPGTIAQRRSQATTQLNSHSSCAVYTS